MYIDWETHVLYVHLNHMAYLITIIELKQNSYPSLLKLGGGRQVHVSDVSPLVHDA